MFLPKIKVETWRKLSSIERAIYIVYENLGKYVNAMNVTP